MQIGISTCDTLCSDNFFAELAEAGIHNIEISYHYKTHSNLDHKFIKRLSQRHGINLWSYHLPFADVHTLDIASSNADVRKYTVNNWSELIRKASEIGIDKFVVHPSSEPKSENADIRREELKYAMDSLDQLARVAASCNSVIAVEDLPRSCLGRDSEEILKLISANDALKVCFDTNHLLREDNLQFIEKLGHKIITLHVSDYDFTDERHWLPGEGKNDWQGIYKKLREVGYDGVWMYELGLNTPKSIIRERKLTYKDFYRNAMEIFRNEPITVIGKPADNL